MARQEVTIYDIARALGVSAATVSRGLKDHRSIGKATRERIKAKAGELGYQSNALASGLRTQRSLTLGVIVPRLNSNFMSTVLGGMEEAASRAGYHLIIMQSFESKQKEAENTHLLFNNRVDGLLVSTTAPSNITEHFNTFFRKDIPVVFFDRPPVPNDQYTSVAINNVEAARKMTTHLLENGCRRIIHVTGNNEISVYKDRTEGYQKALIEFGITPEKAFIFNTSLSAEEGPEIAEQILNMHLRPDAIFVANDTCALTIMHHLRGKGMNIPEDIKVSGFNNDPFSAIMTPALTTVKYPGKQMGIEAVQTIVDKLNNPEIVNKHLNKFIDHEIIIRDSSQ